MAAYQYNPYPNNRNSNNENDQVAIFIDWDNLVISNYADRGSNRPDLEVLIRRAQQYGTVVIARAYAEWNVTADRLEVYKAGIEPIYAPVFHADRDLSGQTTRGKSLADPVMVTDCIDFLHLLPQIGTYVLVTGDKDMVPVVRLARLRGRRVVIIGPDYVANVLQQVSDEFIPYRYLLAQVQAAPDPYAPYYQAPPAAQPTPAQPFYPGQLPATPAQPAQTPPTQTGTDRRGRRLTGNRRNQTAYTPPTPQPYARITPPPAAAAPAPQLGGFNYYAQPGQVPAGYPQPGQVPAGYPQPQPAQTDPYQPATQAQPYGYPQQPGYQPIPTAAAPTVPVQPSQSQPVVTPAPQPTRVFTTPLATAPGFPPATPVQSVPVASAPAAQTVPTAAEPATADASGQNGKAGSSDFNEVKEVIKAILAQRTAQGRSQMRARDLKEELLRRIPNFSERRYGFSKFKALLNAAEIAGVLQIDQSGHILWVSAPGTPKMQFGVGLAGSEEGEGEEEGDEDATNPEAEAELAAQPEAAVAAPNAFVEVSETALTVEPQEATYAEPVGEEASETTMAEPATEVIVPEERTTSLVGNPTAEAEPVRTELNRAESVLGPRPAQLSQPFYQDVIVLVDHLRTRNRWLGYELLLSNVRDLLSREMPESEAKIQAGNILSRLLSDSIIRMAVEVHSRGARKMTVKVAHLQDENPAVRYALEYNKLQAEALAAAAPEGVAPQAEPAEDVEFAAEPEAVATSVEGQTQLQEAATEATEQLAPDYGEGAADWGSNYTQQAHPAEVESEVAAVEAPAVEAGGEAGELGQEAAAVAPEEMPQDAIAEQPVEQPTEQPEAEPAQGADQSVEFSGQAVEASVVEEPGVQAETGETVQGEPETAPQGEEAAPAGGYINTPEMSAEGSQDEAPQEYTPGQSFEENPPAGADQSVTQSEGQPVEQSGYLTESAGQPSAFAPEAEQPVQGESAFDEVPSYEGQLQGETQPENFQAESQEGYQQPTDQSQAITEGDQEGKQVPSETLQPVVELEDEVEEGDDSEEEAESSDEQAPKPARRPRRRRTPRAAATEGEQGPSESMGQVVERHTPFGHHAHPYRRPRTN